MPLESDVDFLGDLDPNSPGPAEFKSEGDDHFRNLKKALRQSFPGATGPILVMGTATGPADAYVLTPARPLVEYRTGMLVAFQITATNATTAPTLNISSLGAKTIKAVDGAALVAGDMPANSYQFLLYNGVDFVQRSPNKAYVDRVVQALRDYVDQLQFSAAFPNQAGNAGKVITTDGTNVSWQWAQNMPTSERSANAMLTQANRASFVVITAGTFTQTFDAAATLGSGWYVFLRNSGTGDITIPASDGRTNWIMYPGEVRLFRCTGTELRSTVIRPFAKVFTTSGNFIKPPGYAYFGGELWGAAGSGVKHASWQYISGGAGGACSPFQLPESRLANSEVVTIGAGGAPVTAADTDGNPGGASWLGTIIGSGGGEGGKAHPDNGGLAVSRGGAPYLGTAGLGATLLEYVGQNGTTESPSIWGGPCGGTFATVAAIPGQSSIFALSKGGDYSATGVAGDGSAPAAGGGATRTGTSGAGARGELRIRGIV